MGTIFRPDLLAHLERQTSLAIENGHVKWTESELIRLDEAHGLAFEVTYAPQLGQKPTQPKTKDDAAPKPKDPFEPPYPPDAFVDEGTDETEGEAFVVLLNKFMVARRHCLLVTKDFAPQTAPPSPALMRAALAVLRSFAAQGSAWQAFYNCGGVSGASQPHQHLQVTPLSAAEAPISALVRAERTSAAVFSLAALPYAHFVTRLDAGSDAGEALFRLLDAMHRHFMHAAGGAPKGISYNLILSPSYLLLVPRSAADAPLGDGIANLAVNALAFSGCVLVKDEKQLARVKQLGSAGLLDLLRSCGFPPPTARRRTRTTMSTPDKLRLLSDLRRCSVESCSLAGRAAPGRPFGLGVAPPDGAAARIREPRFTGHVTTRLCATATTMCGANSYSRAKAREARKAERAAAKAACRRRKMEEQTKGPLGAHVTQRWLDDREYAASLASLIIGFGSLGMCKRGSKAIDAVCGNCGKTGMWRVRATRYLLFVWIPIAPIGRRDEVWCADCLWNGPEVATSGASNTTVPVAAAAPHEVPPAYEKAEQATPSDTKGGVA